MTSSLRSMTGYGASDAEQQGLRVTCQIRTVNHRFFDWKPKIPSHYYPLEEGVRKQIQDEINRGVVEIYLKRQVLDLSSDGSVFDEEKAIKVAHDLRKLAVSMGIEGPLPHLMDWVLRVPEVSLKDVDSRCSEKEIKIVTEVVQKALTQVIHSREMEGKNLKAHCRDILSTLESACKKIEKSARELPQLWFDRLKERLKTWEKQGAVLPADHRLEQELIMMADRSDVTEEMVRMKSHIQALRDLLDLKGPKGKKLEFYVQEMHREVNTTGSKLSDAAIAGTIAEMKSLVEQMREQVQNIE